MVQLNHHPVPTARFAGILLGIGRCSEVFTEHHSPLDLLNPADLRASLEMSRVMSVQSIKRLPVFKSSLLERLSKLRPGKLKALLFVERLVVWHGI